MKKLITGFIIGAAITSAVFYFFILKKEQDQKENLAEIVELLKQGKLNNEQKTEAINDPSTSFALKVALTILIAAQDEYYYYRENDCGKLEKTDLTNINILLNEEKKQRKPEELMILIKMAPGSTIKNSITLLDMISKAGVEPGHFAEIELSEKEINCLQNYKKN